MDAEMFGKKKVGRNLEVCEISSCLPCIRWHRALNALKAMHTMVKLTFPETVPGKIVIKKKDH